MSYDPRKLGARCDVCVLNAETPVPGELRAGVKAILVGEGPGAEEVKHGAPFVGPSGKELMTALAAVGIRRADVAITNTMACVADAGRGRKLPVVLNDLRKTNKRRVAEGLEPLPTPMECCRPRLYADVKSAKNAAGTINVVTLGGPAMEAFGLTGSILALRGGPRELNGGRLRILPTLHPAFVARARRWTRAFRADIGRAFRWFSTGLAWRDPEVLYRPSPGDLRAWLAREAGSPYVVYDVETLPGFRDAGHYDPLFDQLRYLGLCSADGTRAVGLPLLWVSSGERVYTGADAKALGEVLRDFFSSPRWRKAGWNSGYYDRMVIEHTLGVTPAPAVDGIGLHKMVEGELPHRLGFVGSVYTDVPRWKEEFDAKEIRTDTDMKVYNATDCAVTALSISQLVDAVKRRGQEKAARFFPFVQELAVGLHRAGMPVDQERRRWWDRVLRAEAAKQLEAVRALTGKPKLNPNSPNQLRDLFFEEWDLLPFGDPTETGEPSTNDDTLRAFLSSAYDLSPERKRAIKAIRRFRAVTKERGTYVLKLRPIGEQVALDDLAFDADETEEERERRLKKLGETWGLVLPDGRVHADYNAHGTVGWRLSSSRPNCQNFPVDLRDMIRAPDGFVFVACDEGQLELRMVVGLSRAKAYMAAFEADADPHFDLCIDFFGDSFVKAPKEGKKGLRRLAKEFTYASLFFAQPETIHSVLTSSEDWGCPQCGAPLKRFGKCKTHDRAAVKRLLYPDLTVRDTTAFYEKWLGRNPEIKQWWYDTFEERKRLGYLAEPVLGLRRDFLDGAGDDSTANEEVNYKPQSGGAALVHLATQRFLSRYPFDHWGPGTGLVQQGHDAIVAMVPCPHEKWTPPPDSDLAAEFGFCPPKCGCEANRVARFMQECMTERGDEYGLPVPFVGEAAIGKTWRDV